MTDQNGRISRRDLLQRGALGGLGLAGLGSAVSPLDVSEAFASFVEANKFNLSKLIAAAKKEGAINLIALPRDWANYGELMDKFQKKYGLTLTDAAPDDSSAQENQAIVSLKGQDRAPDVVDVGGAAAQAGKKANLYKPYKVSTWNTIPKALKDPNGFYIGDYWGAMSFLSVRSVVKTPPKHWSDLLSPSLRGMVAIDGDPTAASDAFSAVYSAAIGNGGSLNNIQPGIDFFVKVKKAGNWNPTQALPANIAKGATPIAIKWDYLNLATRDELKANGAAATVTLPTGPVYAGPYYQALSASAPHPNAAKLWLEFLYSDAGQLLWLKGYTHPARYLDLASRKKIPAALAKRLPPASSYKSVKFATPNQIIKAQAVLQEQWKAKMG